MKALALFLALCAGAAHADPRIDNMVARCQIVMGPGLCAVSNGGADVVTVPAMPGQPGRALRVPGYRNLGYAKDPATGLYAMCDFIYRTCSADWAGDECLYARYRFKQTPP